MARRHWAVAGCGVLVAALLVVGIRRALPPAPGQGVQVEAGTSPRHYEPELGPEPGLLDRLKAAGTVPADAVDDGDGRFVSAAAMTPDERHRAAARVAARESRRRTGHEAPSAKGTIDPGTAGRRF